MRYTLTVGKAKMTLDDDAIKFALMKESIITANYGQGERIVFTLDEADYTKEREEKLKSIGTFLSGHEKTDDVLKITYYSKVIKSDITLFDNKFAFFDYDVITEDEATGSLIVFRFTIYGVN